MIQEGEGEILPKKILNQTSFDQKEEIMSSLQLTFITQNGQALRTTIPCVRKHLKWQDVCPAVEEIQSLLDTEEILFVEGVLIGIEETEPHQAEPPLKS